MAIFILDNDPAKCAQALDDKSLERMIKNIAQVLCNVHREGNLHKVYDKFLESIPLDYNYKNININKWSQWARECVANYKYLVDLGLNCCEEYTFRKIKEPKNKYQFSIKWAKENFPNLPEFILENRGTNRVGLPIVEKVFLEKMPFPLVIPKKYFKIYPYKMVNIVESYRNYYQSKLKNRSI